MRISISKYQIIFIVSIAALAAYFIWQESKKIPMPEVLELPQKPIPEKVMPQPGGGVISPELSPVPLKEKVKPPKEEIVVKRIVDPEIKKSALVDLAKKYNIEVSDEEMEKAGEIWPEFEGLKPSESLRLLIVQKKAEPYILKYVDCLEIISRWDAHRGPNLEENDKEAKKDMEYVYNLFKEGKSIEEVKKIVTDISYRETPEGPLYIGPYQVWNIRIDKSYKESERQRVEYRKEQGKEVHIETLESEIVKNLKTGEYSKPFRSDGGYYGVLYIKEIGRGEYDTFNEFLKDYGKGSAEY